MKIFYHADLDGECSAYWVKRAIEKNILQTDHYFIKFLKIDYNNVFPINDIKKDEAVIIVDFSIKPEMMDKVLSITGNVIWIDHHITSINAYKDYPQMNRIAGIQKSGKKSGCELTFEYFFPGQELPYFTKLISDFDVWTLSLPNVMEFISACTAYNTSPTSTFFELLEYDDKDRSVDFIEKIMNEGKITIKYAQRYGEEYLKKYGFSTTLNGHSVIAVNAGRFNSPLFGDMINKFDICSPFVFDGEKYTYSLYTKNPDIDVSEIAKGLGGGGHRSASGFTSKQMVFKDIKSIGGLEEFTIE